MRACSSGPISPLMTKRSRKRRLVPLDDALSASRLQAAAELRRLIGGAERPHHGAVVDTFVAEIGALDHGAARSQYRRELALQRPIGGLGVGLVSLRGDLNQVSAAAPAGAGGRLDRIGGGHPGSRLHYRRGFITLRSQRQRRIAGGV